MPTAPVASSLMNPSCQSGFVSGGLGRIAALPASLEAWFGHQLYPCRRASAARWWRWRRRSRVVICCGAGRPSGFGRRTTLRSRKRSALAELKRWAPSTWETGSRRCFNILSTTVTMAASSDSFRAHHFAAGGCEQQAQERKAGGFAGAGGLHVIVDADLQRGIAAGHSFA